MQAAFDDPTCAPVVEALESLERWKHEAEGEPLPPKPDLPPRFGSASLLSTMQAGFRASGVDGAVESVDCTEHPCIIFGRINGDEGEVAKLEDTEAFAAYDDDVGVMLTWASGHGHDDDDHQPDPAAPREKPSEISLFAFAYYSTEEAAQAETLDRRIRARTAAYWNASRPRE